MFITFGNVVVLFLVLKFILLEKIGYVSKEICKRGLLFFKAVKYLKFHESETVL